MELKKNSINFFIQKEKLEKAISYCIERKIQGESFESIYNDIARDFQIIDRKLIEYIITESDKSITKASIINFDDILYSHIYVYEQLYNLFSLYEDNDGMLRSLRQKESLLGINKDYEELKFSVNKILDDKKGNLEYDLDKLNALELKRFNELKQKMSTND